MPNGPEETRKKVEITSKRETQRLQIHQGVVEETEAVVIVVVPGKGAREVKT
jgi:hypothetical protein